MGQSEPFWFPSGPAGAAEEAFAPDGEHRDHGAGGTRRVLGRDGGLSPYAVVEIDLGPNAPTRVAASSPVEFTEQVAGEVTARSLASITSMSSSSRRE